MLSLHFASLSVCFSVLGISDIALGLERVVLCRPAGVQWIPVEQLPLVIRARCSRVSLCILTCLPVLILGPQFLKACCMAWKLLCPWRLIGPHPNCLRPGHNFCRCACEQSCPSVWLVVRPSCDHCRGCWCVGLVSRKGRWFGGVRGRVEWEPLWGLSRGTGLGGAGILGYRV